MAEQFFGITDPGRERDNNEDTFIAQRGTSGFIIAAAIDGVGGYAGGEIASALAREVFLDRLKSASGDMQSVLLDCFHLANERILKEKQQKKDYNHMACVATLAVADIENNQFYFAHVGDTRLYLLRDNSLVKISHDQSFVGFLEDSGRLTEEAAMQHPKRNEISKALGFESMLTESKDYVEVGQSPFLPGDVLLLCSDGLTDMVNAIMITSILSRNVSLKEKGKLLVEEANTQGGKDNITVVLVKNDKAPAQHTAINLKQRDVQKATPAPVAEKKTAKPVKKSRGGLTAFLVILLLASLGINAYQYSQKPPPVVAVVKPVPKGPNAQELKLQHALDGIKNKILVLADTAYHSPIILTKALLINTDSLLIKAKGNITLQCDTGYKGPALQLAERCKSIVLDSLSFTGFTPSIAVANNNLTLKNVRFNNGGQGIESSVKFTDKKYVNGKLPAVVFKTDSLPNKSK